MSIALKKTVLTFGGIDEKRCDSGNLTFLPTLDPNNWIIEADSIKVPLGDEIRNVRVSLFFEQPNKKLAGPHKPKHQCHRYPKALCQYLDSKRICNTRR
jgi:hypothetical protein